MPAQEQTGVTTSFHWKTEWIALSTWQIFPKFSSKTNRIIHKIDSFIYNWHTLKITESNPLFFDSTSEIVNTVTNLSGKTLPTHMDCLLKAYWSSADRFQLREDGVLYNEPINTSVIHCSVYQRHLWNEFSESTKWVSWKKPFIKAKLQY